MRFAFDVMTLLITCYQQRKKRRETGENRKKSKQTSVKIGVEFILYFSSGYGALSDGKRCG